MPGMRAAYASNFIERDATGGTTNNYAGLENKPAAGAEAMPGANNRYVVMNNSNNNMLGSLAPTSIGIGQEGQGIGKV